MNENRHQDEDGREYFYAWVNDFKTAAGVVVRGHWRKQYFTTTSNTEGSDG